VLRAFKQYRNLEPDPLESDLADYPRIVNTALYWLLKGESRLMRHMNFPFGVSILAIARRPLQDSGHALPADLSSEATLLARGIGAAGAHETAHR
jgi:hypothetical protein